MDDNRGAGYGCGGFGFANDWIWWIIIILLLIILFNPGFFGAGFVF